MLQRFDPVGGNPYQKARDYLATHSSGNDLIIGVGGPGMRETLGGFYFGEIIRQNNLAVFRTGRIGRNY